MDDTVKLYENFCNKNLRNLALLFFTNYLFIVL